MSNEWIEWDGERPDGNPWLEAKLPDGRVISGFAGTLPWGRIQAYRLPAAPRAASDKQVAGTHYKEMGVEPWDVVDTWPIEQRIGAYRHGALKYLMRMGSKDESAQEIAKGIHYMEKLLEVLKAGAQ